MLEKAKDWLKKSGIKYIYAGGRSFQGQEMIDDLDPLSEVVPYPDYPLARIYRRNLWMQLLDTYHVLVGDHYDLQLKGHGRKGVLDVLIFPVIARRLIAFASDHENYFLLRIPAGFFGGLLEMLRHFLGGVITLILSPIVTIVCMVSFFKEKEEEKKVGKLKIIEVYRAETDEPDGKFVCRDGSRQDLIANIPKTFKQFMGERNCTWRNVFFLLEEMQGDKYTKYSIGGMQGFFYVDPGQNNDEALEAFKALDVGNNLYLKSRGINA